VKDGKERLVAELLEKAFKHAKPLVPLIKMRDVSGPIFFLKLIFFPTCKVYSDLGNTPLWNHV
jgi:hypothetical protein